VGNWKRGEATNNALGLRSLAWWERDSDAALTLFPIACELRGEKRAQKQAQKQAHVACLRGMEMWS